jgi:catechol 2,3-dioxygenase-like lactoylglutathione lyase family enzyme
MIDGMTLLDGFQHVAIITSDADRLHAFYHDVFDAEVVHVKAEGPGMQLSFIDLGGGADFNVFQIEDNTEALRQTPMFGRGRIDHLGLKAASFEAFNKIRDRLMANGASDGFVTDFGHILSVFFRDPDGLEGEVCVDSPDAQPGVFNPPGTPSARYA